MKYISLLVALFTLPHFVQAQFTPMDRGLTIIVKDGTDSGLESTLQPPGDMRFLDPIRPLGMTEAIQAAAFLERPDYGLTGYLLVFCVNDSISGQQGEFFVDGESYFGVYRLIRQKLSAEEEIPEGMTTYYLSGTVFFLGIS